MDDDQIKLLRYQLLQATTVQERQPLLNDVAMAASQGNEAALEVVLTTVDVHRLALPAIKKLLFSPSDQDDVEQDVLIALASSIQTFRGSAQFTTWLYAVAKNCAFNFLRQRKSAINLPDAPASWNGSFTSLVATKSVVREAIGELPELYGQAVRLRDIEGLSYVEVAASLNLNINTTRARIARGRALLVEIIGAEHIEPPLTDG